MGAINNQRIPPFNPQGSPVGFAPSSQVELGKMLGNTQPAKGGVRPGAAGLLDKRTPAKGAKGGAASGLLEQRVPMRPPAPIPGPRQSKPTPRFDRGNLL